MKKSILAAGALALTTLGNYAAADNTSGSGRDVEVIPGDWDDDGEHKLNFGFKEVPQASFSGLRLTLTCGLPGATILYTTDPDASRDDAAAWTAYAGPLALTEDCTVRFFARAEGYNDSDIQSYTFVYADHQAAAPAIAPDMQRTHMVMTCSTEGARIHFTTDGSEPSAESPLYEGPVEIEANGTFRARAFADDLFDSSITEYTVDFLTVELPSVAFEDKALVISAAGDRETIYFTTDPDAEPGSGAWSLYTGPIALTEDCTVRYYAARDGYNPSAIGAFSFIYAAYQVAAPMLSADEAGTHVTMSCDTPSAEIRYTTDGSEPTAESTLYTAPVEITGNGTFRARAFADGLFDSNTVDYIVMHLAVPAPTAAFENKRLILTCADEKATIYYTTDQAAAIGDADAWKPYDGPIALTEDCTVRFYAQRDNFNDSDIQSFAFVYSTYRVADPSIERDAEGTHIVMATSTEGAEIRYTMDGSEPTAESALYTGPIPIEGNFTFSAIAIADGLFDSAVNRYVVSNMATPDPTATFENLRMTLACPDEKAQIWFTMDPDATPDDISGWTLYTAPLQMTGDCTLRFFARRDNFNDSDIESLTFVYAAYQAQAPSIERNSQGTHIAMATAVEGGSIRYTADGTEPTIYSDLYEKPIRIQEGATYRARVFADNMYASEISEYVIGNDRLAVPTATYDHFTLVLTADNEEAGIWYTTDPDLTLDNVEAWTPYTGPIALGDDCTYRFFAGDDDANASDIQSFVFQKADWQVAVPTIERDEAGTHVVIETPTEGAEIRYTTDGSEPTKESSLYTEPIEIKGNFTYRARAFADGLYDSEITDFTVANMASPVAAASFENKVLTLTCPDPEAEIWYTNDDDATPEDDEAWELYTGPVALSENCFIHFFTRKPDFNDSDIETFVFLRASYMAAAPSIERSEDGRSVVMTTETEGAEIRYTTDGSDPTEESELYTEPVFLTQNCTFRARTFAEGLFESAISDFTVANLMMMMPHAEFQGLRLTLSVWDEAASIWYTTNPDALPEDEEAWTLYTEPIALDADCTVRYFARRGGFLDSQIATYDFVYSDWQAAAPAIRYEAEGQIISVECLTEGAEIRYTTDGSEPTAESELYTAPIAMAGNFTFRARAFAEGLFDSNIADFSVEDMTAAPAAAAFENLHLVLSCTDPEASILYTFEAEAEADSYAWTIYTEPLSLEDDCTVRYFTRRADFNDSAIQSYQFIYADWQTAKPSITVEDGSLVMASATEGAEIRYTMDGSEPTAESMLYTAPIEPTGNFTFRARAFAEGLFDSETAEYTVTGLTAASASASFEDLHLVLSCPDADAEILYSIKGEGDAGEWSVYSEPIALTEDCTVSYFTRSANLDDSAIQSYEFIYADWQAVAPTLEYDQNYKEVTITCETEGAEIRYTTDGSEPTEESEIYEGPIHVSGKMTIKARAFAEGLFASETSSISISGTSAVDDLLSDGASIRVERDTFGVTVIADQAVSIPVYTIDGKLLCRLDLQKGRNRISGLDGICIIAGKKVKF